MELFQNVHIVDFREPEYDDVDLLASVISTQVPVAGVHEAVGESNKEAM